MMGFVISAIGFVRNSWIGKALVAVAGLLITALWIFNAGERKQKRKQKIANLEEHIDVRDRADSAADAARKVGGTLSDDELAVRLRKHGALRD